MSPIRAYCLPPDPTSVIDASHPVEVDQLDALGYKISFVRGNPSEIDRASRKLAQETGYPVTQEGGIVQFSLDVESHVAEIDPDMLALLMKVVEAANSDICSTTDVLIAITSGSPYFDIEDVTTTGWIRIHFVSGLLVRVPAGAKYRLDFNEQNRETMGTAFFKETVSNHGYLTKKEIDNHPVRRAYLDALGIEQI